MNTKKPFYCCVVKATLSTNEKILGVYFLLFFPLVLVLMVNLVLTYIIMLITLHCKSLLLYI